MRAVDYGKAALRTLLRQPLNTQDLLRGKIEQHARDPESLSANVAKLQGRPGLRLRVGDWRIIFDEDGTVLVILEIGARGGIYRWERPMSVQTIVTPAGERLVVLSETEFLRLREAAETADDVAAYDRARWELSQGQDERVPAAIATRLLDGENRIRVWREHRGLSARALSEAAGIGAAHLSQIETGKREGSIETLKRIAAALSVGLDDLV